jgi:predicted Zn-dependent protease with MMP-like domain
MHEESIKGDLYTLGDYHHDAMGRYIFIYYGSLMNNYPHYTPVQLKTRLTELLLHEFTHHLESLAGEHGLEDKDKISIAEYKKQHSA